MNMGKLGWFKSRSLSAWRKAKQTCGFSAVVLAGSMAASVEAQVEYVDPKIGGLGFMLEPTRPTVQIPNGMLRMYPVRNDQLDDRIYFFPLSTISHRQGEIFRMMPCDAGAVIESWGEPAACDQQKQTPYYYSTRFDSSLIQTEFSPSERCGFFRFTFPSGKPAVFLANLNGGKISFSGSNVVAGIERFNGMQAYLYGEFDAALSPAGHAAQSRLTLLGAAGRQTLQFRYAISYISVEQAKLNLQKEVPKWSFDSVKKAARARWNHVLGQIQVEGGSEAQKRVFYTSLYRCYERMINISEDGQYYSGYDHKIHQDTRPFYVDNWLWDTYRALEPLHTILNPEMMGDKIQSYVRMYEQLGWMPCFSVLHGNHECMTGNHAAPWIADAWAKGIRNFDVKTAYAGLRKNSIEGTWLPWRKGPKCELDDFLAEHGYMPALRPGEKETVARVHPFEARQAVSVTLAQSYDDWCTAHMAKAVGNEADYQLFMKRAANYKNVFRADKNSMWPKDAEGKWIEPFDPKFSGGMGGRAYTTENNILTYNWDVQHDIQGLFAMMGGLSAAEKKMDQLFREGLDRSKYEFWARFPDASGLVGQFSMGNEPSLAIPYMYNYMGTPWKTQKRVRMLLDTWFTDTLLGMPGDEDGGGMSAFVVFSMMGLYPVTPGLPVYNLTSPVFNRVTIRLTNGKRLTISAPGNSVDNKYIQSVRLNGKDCPQVWVRHADLMRGGELEMRLGNVPNLKLGSEPSHFPPSAMAANPSDY